MKIFRALLAGLLGGLANSLGLWASGAAGINRALGFRMAPELSAEWLLPRLAMSALWGLLFLLPFWNSRPVRKGMLLSIGPLLVMLYLIFPKMGAGLYGLKLGATAPLFAVFFTLVWGVVAGLVLKGIGR